MRYISLLGLAVMIGLAWLMSSHKNRFPWRVVLGGLVLQFVFAVVILRTTPGEWIFGWVNTIFVSLLSGVEVGSRFVFGETYAEHFFAFKVLPTIIFFSALMSVFYYYGVIQKIVGLFALVMQKTLGTSGAETLSAAANVFVGQTEAPLVIRPYISSMTTSELNAVMVGGFATMAGGVLGALSEMGFEAGHLLSASVISAPGALLLSKVMQPEVDEPKTLGNVQIDIEEKSTNVLEAVAVGTTGGMKLALNVGAMLIVFLAMIAMINMLVGWVGVQFGYGADGNPLWSLEAALSYLFYPLAWLIGIERADCMRAG
ncbi:MAG: NupC/NupG family nucleoside CNT transporter, partial [Planctomycetes bacterium]|nr:NupC/NupG family nucleoside CNT transporter [Planctomycetota bacterium]